MGKVNYDDLSLLKPLDVDKVSKSINLQKLAKEAGAANRPDKSAKDFDANERAIISRLQEHRSAIRADLASRHKALDSDIAAQKSKLLSALHITDAKNRFTELKHDLKAGQRQLRNAATNFGSAKDTLDLFKSKRGITDVPPPAKTFLDNFAILIVFVFLEGFANLFFFSHGNELGLLGGFMIAGAISAANVFGFYFFSLFFAKFIHSVSLFIKFFGALAIMSIITMLFGFHTFIAFYRQAMYLNSSYTVNEGTQTAWDGLLSLNFSYLDIVSIGLMVVGIGFGAYAAYKGFTKGHPYPGYERRYKNFISFEDALEDEEQYFRDEYLDGIHDVSVTLKGVLSNQGGVKASLQRLFKHKAATLKRVDELDTELAENGNALLSKYRALNIKARSKKPPKYFESLYLENEHFGSGTKGNNYDQLAETGSITNANTDLEYKANKLLDEMDQMGEDLMEMLELSSNA